MIRLGLLLLYIAGASFASLRNWYTGLCALVLLTVVNQHPSFPTNMLGYQGMNPWNTLLAIVVLCWLMQRWQEPARAPCPPMVTLLFSAYVILVIVAGLVAVLDVSSFIDRDRTAMLALVDTIINPLKYIVVGVLFFDGARSRRRISLALYTAVFSGLCYALLMLKSMKWRVFTIDFADARRMTDKLIGLFANDMGELLAFAIWAGLILAVLVRVRWQRWCWLAVTLAAVPPYLALKSRAGYFSALMVGLVLGALRWRRILVILPGVAVLIAAVSPTVVDRILMGVEENETDWDAVSAGRTTYLWPAAIEQIARAPWLGGGRYTMQREPLVYERILELGGGHVSAHPHSSYLEILLDAGLLGFMICMLAAGGILLASARLFRSHGDPLLVALGGAGVAAMVAELAAGVAGSSFFATQSAVPYVCVWGCVLGVRAEQRFASDARSWASQPTVTARRSHPALGGWRG